MTDEAKLAALLGSRICHDLISPIGAIGNGVELLQMSGTAAGPELSLIEESVANANSRIRFFRIAFGSASPGQAIARREVTEILAAMSKAGRLSYNWHPETDRDRSEVKLAFLLIQCLESSMPYGGTIDVAAEGDRWTITGSAQRNKSDPGLWALLTGETGDAALSPGTVHFALAAGELAMQERNLEAEVTETEITVRF